jgi:hypothetical protein
MILHTFAHSMHQPVDSLDRQAIFDLTEQLKLLELQNQEFERQIHALVKKVGLI